MLQSPQRWNEAGGKQKVLGELGGGLWGWESRGAGAGDPLSVQRLPHKIRKLHSALERMLVSAAPSLPISLFPVGFAPASQKLQSHRGAVEVLAPHFFPLHPWQAAARAVSPACPTLRSRSIPRTRRGTTGSIAWPSPS